MVCMVRPVMGVAVLAAAAIGEGMKDEQIGACASCQVLDLITHMSKSISGIEKVYFLSSFFRFLLQSFTLFITEEETPQPIGMVH